MPPKSPDLDLSPLNYQQVNETFYAAAPADYFNQRLLNLVLVAGNREGLDQLVRKGVGYGEFSIGELTREMSQDERDESAKNAANFVSAEAEVLAHHAGEALLRLYLAHEFRGTRSFPECPALDLARVRSPSAFKAQVEARFGERSDPLSRENSDAVARVFQATAIRENLGPVAPEPEAWDRSLQLIEGFLRAFAREHLDRAALYNAAKHGLALTPSEMGVQMGDGSLLKVEGPVIHYLQIASDDQNRPRWQQVAHWVRADRQMALIYRMLELIETLWRTARYRYLAAERASGYRFHLVTGPTYAEMLYGGREPAGGVEINEVSWELIYLRD